jgi:hypothetical protein
MCRYANANANANAKEKYISLPGLVPVDQIIINLHDPESWGNVALMSRIFETVNLSVRIPQIKIREPNNHIFFMTDSIHFCVIKTRPLLLTSTDKNFIKELTSIYNYLDKIKNDAYPGYSLNSSIKYHASNLGSRSATLDHTVNPEEIQTISFSMKMNHNMMEFFPGDDHDFGSCSCSCSQNPYIGSLELKRGKCGLVLKYRIMIDKQKKMHVSFICPSVHIISKT